MPAEHTFESTTFEWRYVKIGRPAGGQGGAPEATLRRWWHLPALNPRKPFSITLKYRGGAECWVEVHARGSAGRYPGSTALIDVLREISRT